MNLELSWFELGDLSYQGFNYNPTLAWVCVCLCVCLSVCLAAWFPVKGRQFRWTFIMSINFHFNMINWAGEEGEVNDHRYYFMIKETVANSPR